MVVMTDVCVTAADGIAAAVAVGAVGVGPAAAAVLRAGAASEPEEDDETNMLVGRPAGGLAAPIELRRRAIGRRDPAGLDRFDSRPTMPSRLPALA
jgi:hypothetical protein